MSAVQHVENINATRSIQYVSVYSNNVQVNTNFFDTSLIFSEMVGIEDGVLQVEQRVRVVMGLAQVKLLTVSLLQQLHQYEKEFGVVELSPKIVPPELANFLATTPIDAPEETRES